MMGSFQLGPFSKNGNGFLKRWGSGKGLPVALIGAGPNERMEKVEMSAQGIRLIGDVAKKVP
jgi:hypothetical protein